ncbi:Lipin/Ned1/Smp2-domain-containing protein [Fusarium flagelliforme]|uniref:Nuclear elongation and deformation protein 1 n=1 Tax=Fusarium flagelliforme TaxID=2675880 RepID=A0A395MVB3_9HYPO|nr:Lipin/Ned1/Smp2-domain-containing protein [Fusarium flagelliforme]KAH7197194.1 Lipin/Ned1/Smp2-domain-containing protein [Fusarium flagelliforme]RFN51139.1 nuclear elongation and deformation protein 1 [Fusarium flagelliforme]
MQYVRGLSESVSTAWNSINPATLSGAIDVIVVEHEDGSLVCSPFHVRFGKFSLLRPSDKKVEFKVNGVKQSYSMKLGEGGEAFFVFETTDRIPQSLQTSPLVSPASSPASSPPLNAEQSAAGLQEPEAFELDASEAKPQRPPPSALYEKRNDNGLITPLSTSPELPSARPVSGDWSSTKIPRPHSEDILRPSARSQGLDGNSSADDDEHVASERSSSPPPLSTGEALQRARALSKGLSAASIPTKVTDTGDLMLDMTGFKGNEEDILRAEILARQILSEELDGNYDIGALFGFDEQGNLWIYSSEEAKQAAMNKTIEASLQSHRRSTAADAISDPGYQSDSSDATASPMPLHRRTESDAGPIDLQTPPRTPPGSSGHAGDPNRNYAKTLRLTSQQLKDLKLKPGANSMAFTVNRATCKANMYLWRHETPVVISDIDGTITKSDALGHVLNMIGRDWTHSGVAKLYSDISANGYNIMYLTSRSVGQSDTTRAYLAGIVQDGYKMPPGPTILSPDRTMAALRREVYLRKPHIFKMATLRDIRNLYGPDRTPFYAGYGNRLTDQISYRTVDVPRNRIFTINSNSEVSLDLLTLNKLKMSYVNINEVVDHYFPPVSTLVKGGGEEYTDFTYWRDDPLAMADFSASESDDEDDDNGPEGPTSEYGDDEEEYDDEEDAEVDEDMDAIGEGLADSYISRASMDEFAEASSVLGGSVDEEKLKASMARDLQEAYDEDDEDEIYEDGEEGHMEGEGASNPIPLGNKKAADLKEDILAQHITGVGHLSQEK